MSDDPKSIAADIARELRESPQRWTQGALSKDAKGKSLMHAVDCTRSPDAACWCLMGHIIRRASSATDREQTQQRFREIIGLTATDGIADWNDAPDRTVGEVIAVCERMANG